MKLTRRDKLTILKSLGRLDAVERKLMLSVFDDKAIDVLSNLAHEILYSPIWISQKNRKKAKELFLTKELPFRKIANNRRPIKQRRLLLKQEGGIMR